MAICAFEAFSFSSTGAGGRTATGSFGFSFSNTGCPATTASVALSGEEVVAAVRRLRLRLPRFPYRMLHRSYPAYQPPMNPPESRSPCEPRLRVSFFGCEACGVACFSSTWVTGGGDCTGSFSISLSNDCCPSTDTALTFCIFSSAASYDCRRAARLAPAATISGSGVTPVLSGMPAANGRAGSALFLNRIFRNRLRGMFIWRVCFSCTGAAGGTGSTGSFGLFFVRLIFRLILRLLFWRSRVSFFFFPK